MEVPGRMPDELRSAPAWRGSRSDGLSFSALRRFPTRYLSSSARVLVRVSPRGGGGRPPAFGLRIDPLRTLSRGLTKGKRP
jgi:hypothetical protein